MKKCPFCAEEIQDEAIVCKHCGRDLKGGASQVQLVQPKKPTSPLVWGCVFLLGIVTIICAVGIFSGNRAREAGHTPLPPVPTTTLTKDQADARAKAAETSRRQHLTSGLAAAKKMSANSSLCDEPKALADVWANVRLVRKDDPEWAEAVAVVPKLETCRKKVEQSLSKGLQSIMVAQRQSWAAAAEKKMLDEGMEVDFRLSGPKKDLLTIKWALMGKVAVHKITNDDSVSEGSFLSQMQKVGFRKVTFTDDYDFGVTYTLRPADETKGGNTVLAGMGLGAPLRLQ